MNDIYRNTYTGVPLIRLGYTEMNFVIAEAIEKGWLKGNAQSYYEEGIKASFEFVRNYISSQYNHGREITDEYIANYLRGPYVSYKTDGEQMDRLKQIWMQVYLARFFHSYYDDYYDYRRNKYPEYPINPNTNLNDEKNKIPMRWMYPENELFYNKEQYYSAIERQWQGTDDVNNLMWILK